MMDPDSDDDDFDYPAPRAGYDNQGFNDMNAPDNAMQISDGMDTQMGSSSQQYYDRKMSDANPHSMNQDDTMQGQTTTQNVQGGPDNQGGPETGGDTKNGAVSERQWNLEVKRTLATTILGKVKLAKDLISGDFVVVKFSSLKKLESTPTNENPIEEVKKLTHLQTEGAHPRITECLGQALDPDYHYMILEYVPGGEFFGYVTALFDHVEHESPGSLLDEKLVGKWFGQMLEGLSFIHRKGIVHLDLKMENLLITDDHDLKICDFGMAQYLEYDAKGNPKPMQGLYGTPRYMAYEMYNSPHQFDGQKADIYSFGVVLFILLTTKPPYDRPTRRDTRFTWIFGGRLAELLSRWQIDISPDAIDLLNHMICPEAERYSIEEILQHPWFQRVYNP